MAQAFTASVLNRYDVLFWLCSGCGWLASERPYWLQEAYANATAHQCDTGLVARNVTISRQLTVLLLGLFGRDGRYVDVAGGTGLLVRLMRDAGFDFFWHDPYCENVHARGFELRSSDQPCRAITAFEVLEHLEDPLGFVSSIMADFRSDTIICSTQLFEGRPPRPEKWFYYAFGTGQHIAFFQRRTLEKLATRLDLRFYSCGGIHIFTRRNISEWMLKMATWRIHWLVWPFARKVMSSRSRTMKDHELMRQARKDGA